MKKILSLLTGLTLISSSSVSVISCSDKVTKVPADNIITNRIVNKIEGHTKVFLKNVFGNVSTGDNTVIQAMKNTIKTLDGLSNTDINKINFEVKNINNINYTEVDIYVNENNQKYRIRDVKFITNANATQSLAHKIQNGQINNLLPTGTNPDTTKTATITAMKNALQTNDKLSDTDISGLTFGNVTLSTTEYKIVNITVQLGSDKSILVSNIKFKISSSATDVLASKIKNGEVNNLLPTGTNPDTTNTVTKTAMKNVLKTNDKLSDTDIAGLTFGNVTLSTNLYKIVNITVQLGSDSPITVSNVKFKIQSNTPPTPGTGLGKSKNVPFIDVTSVNSGKNNLSASDVYNKFGQHQIMAAFVSAYSNSGAAWTQSEQFSDQNTNEAKWIKDYEALGGKVGISFGGALSSSSKTTPWDYLTVDQLTNMLNTAVNVYKAKAIDYDIEPSGNFDSNKMDKLVTATNNILETNPGIDISLTMAVIPTDKWGTKFWGGTTDKSRTAINEFKKFSKTPIINPMAFDFGQYYIPTENDYLPKIESIAGDAADYWSKIFNVDRTKFLQNNIELTTMIGRSDQAKGKAWREFLDKDKATAFAKWAKSQNLYRISYWCLNRDFPGNPNFVSEHNNGTNNPEGTFNKINLDNFEN